MAAAPTTPTTTPTAIATVLLDFAFCCSVAVAAGAVDVCAIGVSVTMTVLPGAMLVTTDGCAVVCVGVFVVWLFWLLAVDDGAADDDEDCELEPDCCDDPEPDALPTLLDTPVR